VDRRLKSGDTFHEAEDRGPIVGLILGS
jgi:hypothetical protein